jgi:TQXA domain-containing protein/LPXTG-motif cell wall-anchored protein
MITAQRQRGRRRAAAIAASLALASGLVAGLAAPASAEGEAELIGRTADNNATVEGTVGGVQNITAEAGLFDVQVGDQVLTVYCLDLEAGLDPGATLPEIPPSEADIDNLDIIEAILRWYHPNGSGPEGHTIEGTPAQQAAATQAAIWHFSNGFDLDQGGDNDPVIVANYLVILAAVEAGLEGLPEPSLTITPPASTEGTTGQLVGPYTIVTNATGVTLTASEGITIHNEDGSPFTGEVVDGTQVWLSSETEGAGTLSATGTGQSGTLRIFFKKHLQELGFVALTNVDVGAEAPVSFTTPPPTTAPSTTTTVVDTTTTVPLTPDTTVVGGPTTTVPITPQANGGLPVTGAETVILIAVALLLLALGAGFGIVSRRRRLQS